MEDLKIVYLSPDDLTPYENNARRHGEEDVAAIARSIQEFGFDDPIGVWGEDNIIVEGHGHMEAAKQLGMETVPCVRLDHLTEDQRKAYALAHNKTAELSGWDFATLEGELNDLEGLFDMTDFGFSESKEGSDEQHEGYVDDFFDRGVEAKDKPVVLGVKVVCGTKEQVEEVMRLLTEAES